MQLLLQMSNPLDRLHHLQGDRPSYRLGNRTLGMDSDGLSSHHLASPFLILNPSSECGRSMNDWMRLRVWGCFSHYPSVRPLLKSSIENPLSLPVRPPRRRLILPSNSQSRTGGEGGAGEDLWRRGGRACAGVAGRRRSQKASNLNQQTREEECGAAGERRLNFCGSIGKRRLDNENGEQVTRWHLRPTNAT